MAIRTIREEGDEILRKKSREVEKVDEKIKELINDMFETMVKYNGVGLSAVQVGVLKKVIVIDTGEPGERLVLINPKIIKEKGEQTVEEGCLSFPNKFGKIVRPNEVTVVALDENGKEFKTKAKELLAQAICHEVDHLNGELFIDKILPGTLEIINPEDQK
ncbi:MAG: peptide deformylase [Clostridia bacterium]|nr:peptide deformylase [Clostridia bacterium]